MKPTHSSTTSGRFDAKIPFQVETEQTTAASSTNGHCTSNRFSIKQNSDSPQRYASDFLIEGGGPAQGNTNLIANRENSSSAADN